MGLLVNNRAYKTLKCFNYIFLSWTIRGPFFFIFVFSMQLPVYIKFTNDCTRTADHSVRRNTWTTVPHTMPTVPIQYLLPLRSLEQLPSS